MLEKSKTKNKIKGNFGEDIVEKYLVKNDFEILNRNFKCNFGEIDIIFKDKDEIVFAEIKTRTGLEYGFPVESVTYFKKKHILNTAKYFIYINELENIPLRFDIIEVLLLENQKPIINHIKNVFW